MQIDLGNFVIRSYKSGDVSSLAKSANSRAIWINLRDRFPHPYTIDDAEQWIELVTSLVPETNFAIAVNGDVVGGIGILQQSDVHAHSAELGYWLGEKHWGKGIMSKAVPAMTDYLFANFDIVRLYATVFAWNPASAKVLEKCGWEYEGRLRMSVFKDGKYCDQLIYGKLKQQPKGDLDGSAN